MEVMEARLIRAAEVNAEVDDDDAGGSEVGNLGIGLGVKPVCPPWSVIPPLQVCLPL